MTTIAKVARQIEKTRAAYDLSHPDHPNHWLWRRLEPHRPRRGRPVGSGQYPTPESLELALYRARATLRRRNVKPTPDLMVDAMLVSKRRLYELLNEHDLMATWREILRSE